MPVVIRLATLLIAVLAGTVGVEIGPFHLVALALLVVFLGMSFQYHQRAVAVDEE